MPKHEANEAARYSARKARGCSHNQAFWRGVLVGSTWSCNLRGQSLANDTCGIPPPRHDHARRMDGAMQAAQEAFRRECCLRRYVKRHLERSQQLTNRLAAKGKRFSPIVGLSSDLLEAGAVTASKAKTRPLRGSTPIQCRPRIVLACQQRAGRRGRWRCPVQNHRTHRRLERGYANERHHRGCWQVCALREHHRRGLCERVSGQPLT